MTDHVQEVPERTRVPAARADDASVPGPTDAAHERESDTFIASFARGLSVIRAFGPQHAAMTLSEVAVEANITRAGARRALLTLHRLGYVTAIGRKFRLTPKILELGYAYISSLDVWDCAEPIMRKLVEMTEEAASAAVLDGDDVINVLRVPSRRIVNVDMRVGTRLPAYATATGRVLLANLSESDLSAYLLRSPRPARQVTTVTDAPSLRAIIADVRRQRWALVDGELAAGLLSIAVPLRDGRGSVIAALNVSTHASRATSARMIAEMLPQLQEAQALIECGLPLAQ